MRTLRFTGSTQAPGGGGRCTDDMQLHMPTQSTIGIIERLRNFKTKKKDTWTKTHSKGCSSWPSSHTVKYVNKRGRRGRRGRRRGALICSVPDRLLPPSVFLLLSVGSCEVPSLNCNQREVRDGERERDDRDLSPSSARALLCSNRLDHKLQSVRPISRSINARRASGPTHTHNVSIRRDHSLGVCVSD